MPRRRLSASNCVRCSGRRVSVTVILGRNGHSKNPTIGAPFDGKPPGKCAVQAFSNLTFPPWNGPDTPLTVDVELTKPAVGAR